MPRHGFNLGGRACLTKAREALGSASTTALPDKSRAFHRFAVAAPREAGGGSAWFPAPFLPAGSHTLFLGGSRQLILLSRTCNIANIWQALKPTI